MQLGWSGLGTSYEADDRQPTARMWAKADRKAKRELARKIRQHNRAARKARREAARKFRRTLRKDGH